MKVLVALVTLLFVALPAEAGTMTAKWDPAASASSYDLEQSVDVGVTWTLNRNVTAAQACSGSPARCSVDLVLPNTGVVLVRITAVNSVGKSTRYTDNLWHCQSCLPPPAVTNVGAP